MSTKAKLVPQKSLAGHYDCILCFFHQPLLAASVVWGEPAPYGERVLVSLQDSDLLTCCRQVLAVGCSLECHDECGNPKPQGCYKDLRWVPFYAAIVGGIIILVQVTTQATCTSDTSVSGDCLHNGIPKGQPTHRLQETN